MELYLDTANVAEVERLARIFPIAGVTTNPSIIAASKESIWEVLPRLQKAIGDEGIRTVQELQALLEMHAPESMVLAASFKTPRQALDCLLAGCESITLPLDVAQQMLNTPAVESAIEKFEHDWNAAFGTTHL